MDRIRNYINGEFVAPISGDYLETIDPATGRVYGQVPDGDQRDVELAVEAAEKAFPSWSTTAADDRSRMLLKIADLIEADLERFARAECIDTGKPLSVATTIDIPRAVRNFRFFATALLCC